LVLIAQAIFLLQYGQNAESRKMVVDTHTDMHTDKLTNATDHPVLCIGMLAWDNNLLTEACMQYM